jgi:tRNA 2-thiocytidine biosynthesis protein TtcA
MSAEESPPTVGEDPVDPDDARELLGSGSARAIDLRDPDVAAKGHAPGAIIVGEDDPREAVERARHGEEVPVLVFCDDGSRSAEVASELRDAGLEAAAVEGGFRAWSETGLPELPRSDEEYEGPELKQPGG